MHLHSHAQQRVFSGARSKHVRAHGCTCTQREHRSAPPKVTESQVKTQVLTVSSIVVFI